MVAAENNSSTAVLSVPSGEAVVPSSPGVEITIEVVAPPKKKRNLPGMPDPDAEVIALSPKSLLATNRFVCEICNKGFQRDQNLQLHRRGHNLPWKLRQRTSKEIRKRVYVCPEPSCVHHNPARALGDLTGIKKHFSRKHGEKKWKCERCSKKYAVQSDWKAHMKTCGTREYKCDCGTLFSRRDSFITHRAFCDALAEETARSQPQTLAFASSDSNATAAVTSPPPPPLTPSTTVLSPALSIQSSEPPDNPIGPLPLTPAVTSVASAAANTITPTNGSGVGGGGTSVFAGVYASSSAVTSASHPPQQPSSPRSFSNRVTSGSRSDCVDNNPPTTTISGIEPASLSLSTSLYLSCRGSGSSMFGSQDHPHYLPSPQPAAMSATALLQKAAQMGVTTSNASLLRGLGLSSMPAPGQETAAAAGRWNRNVHAESSGISMTAGLGLGLHSATNSELTNVMMGQSAAFESEPMTRDLLGLGIGGGGASTGGLSALLTSFGGGCDVEAASPYSIGGGGGSSGGTNG